MLLYILLFIPLMNAKYIATHVINTNFKKQNDNISFEAIVMLFWQFRNEYKQGWRQ